jgi:hypothetical protein
MKFSRRVFFSALLFARSRRAPSLQVTVLETFDLDGKSVAVLVHHVDSASREQFAQWLQSRPKSSVLIRSNAGRETRALVFRVRMCFGRALILLQGPVQIRERDVLTIIA